MKKILTHLTGIVFLITILIAAGCNSATENDSQTFTDPTVPTDQTVLTDPTDPTDQRVPEEVDTVTICLGEAFEDNDGKHLRMYDSHYPDNIIVDNLETFVWPGTVVIWEVLDGSGIRKLKKISPKNGNGNIMHRDASGFFYTLFTGKKKFKVLEDAPRPSEREEYLIKFKYKDNKTKTVDPYLKIPR